MATKFRATYYNGHWYVGEYQVSNGYFLGLASDNCECQARAEAYAEEMNQEANASFESTVIDGEG